MASRSVVTLTTAPAGTGKTYRRCAHFLVTELLPDTELKHLSNFPVKFEPWQDGQGNQKRGLIEVCRLRDAATEEEVLDRIELIPDWELQKWLDGSSGPWDTFKEKDLSGYHLAIDEIHNYCGKNTHVNIRKQWQTWLGELRHRGARIEFISQHPQKIAKEIREEAEILLELHSGETEHDPWFNISMADWYQVIARVTGKYRPCVFEVENRQQKSRWIKNSGVKFRFESDLFETYDSFSAPIQGGGSGKLAKEPWQRLNGIQFFLWFLTRNLWCITSRFAIVGLFAWLSLFGGGAKSMTFAMEYMKNHVHKSNGVDAKDSASQTETVSQRIRREIQEANPGSTVTVDGAPSVVVPARVEPRPEPPKVEPISDEDIEKEAAAWALAAVTEEGIWFSNGEYYLIGERIEDGPYENGRVERVDLSRRRAHLDGRVLRLRNSLSNGLREWAKEVIRKRREPSL